jgi:hypothetical protein
MAIAVVGAFGGQSPIIDSLAVSFYVVLICAAVNVAEIKRRHELAFLRNLGVTSGQLAVLFTVPAIAGETFARLVTLPLR